MFDRVLGGDDVEMTTQRVIRAVDRDRSLIHRLQQGGLGLGRRAVDLVRQQDVGEDRPLHEPECIGAEIEQIGAQDIARHQVRRELDTPEIERKSRGETAREEGLCRTRRPFQEHMATRKDGDQQLINNPVLAMDRLTDFRAQRLGALGELFKGEGHASSRASL